MKPLKKMTASTIKKAQWLHAEETRLVVEALGPAEMRFVGGAVRDVLLGRTVSDIDIATVLPPGEVMRRLKPAGIKTLATGFSHGTVTAITEARAFEITTLRIDAETFGRRARVEFTDDWALDASRRDFTINALYADADGVLYDPLGGLADLEGPVVRFIGDAAARIKEDALRILRLFRLSAELGLDRIDDEGLKAATGLRHLIGGLSAERIRSEFMKLLAARRPVPVLGLMARAGILEEVLPLEPHPERLASLIGSEGKQKECDVLRRLFALFVTKAEDITIIAQRLKLSRQEHDRLRAMMAAVEILSGPEADQILRESLYQCGRQATRDALYLTAESGLGLVMKQLDNLEVPVFPLGGDDLKAFGMAQGEELGEALKKLEKKWIAGGFHATGEALLKELKS